ncbi:fatty acyl CoA synthetase [Lysobacter sp. BMK333-48F3]|uniref:LolA-related protein n=1 Tax=Lysobacter sp. BMK333-48F3 TaxID=2867962 RepID=UPI001C8B0B7B|nr:LolA-related protein [Lysobacter sp. BMK333-48F3]MBX9400755.1 fatty acyl CoA synthetase [Lysobacter sp. BMK333-48F3]
MPMTIKPCLWTLALLCAAASLHAAPVTEAGAAQSAPAAAPAEAAPADPAWILPRLAQPAPARTDFVEVRGSALLKQPLRLSGEYRRPDAATLVREVRAPYAETTTIQAGAKPGQGEVSVVRPNKPAKRFSLARAPELVALQASFGALLGGDRALLEQHYRLAAEGTRRQWTISLIPKDAGLAARVREIVLLGRDDELRCIETRPARGNEQQRTLLASAARAAANVADASQLAALCRGHGAAR